MTTGWYPMRFCITPLLEKHLFWAYLILFASGITLAAWTATRVNPIVILKQESIPTVHAGDLLRVEAVIKRDTSGKCQLEEQRYIMSSHGYHFVDSDIHFSAPVLDKLMEVDPNRLRMLVYVPKGISIGRARLIVSLKYHCNPLDQIWPIETMGEVAFDVVE